MKRLLIQILVMAVLCIGWSCCPQAAALEKEEKNVEEQVNEILTGMSTEQKLAQMMIITLRSDMQGTKCVTQLDPSYEDLLEKGINTETCEQMNERMRETFRKMIRETKK